MFSEIFLWRVVEKGKTTWIDQPGLDNKIEA